MQPQQPEVGEPRLGPRPWAAGWPRQFQGVELWFQAGPASQGGASASIFSLLCIREISCLPGGVRGGEVCQGPFPSLRHSQPLLRPAWGNDESGHRYTFCPWRAEENGERVPGPQMPGVLAAWPRVPSSPSQGQSVSGHSRGCASWARGPLRSAASGGRGWGEAAGRGRVLLDGGRGPSLGQPPRCQEGRLTT